MDGETAGESADGGGRRWERLARTVGIDLLTLASPETIHPGSDNVINFCSKNGPGQKTQEGRPLPKRIECACKKNTRPDAISQSQSPQSVVNSYQNPSLKMKSKPRKKLKENNLFL